MDLVRPSWLRAATLLVFALLVALAPAGPVAAHNGTGGESSDYRVTITGWKGDPSGVSLRIIELGNRVELTRDGADVVYVLGYDGEQYLRLASDGVWENVNSPAHYLNADRFAATQPPDDVTAATEPSWQQVSSGDTARWHDHRAHYMSVTPAPSVQANPDAGQVVHVDEVSLVVDGRAVSADVEVRWLPKPERINWLAAASVLAAAVTAAVVLIAPFRRIVPVLAVDAGVAALLGQGGSTTRLVIAGVVVGVALLGALLHRPLVSAAGGAAAGVLAATRLEVFEHELLAGWLPGPWQRIAIVVALGLGLGVAAASLVSALSPTPVGTAGPGEPGDSVGLVAPPPEFDAEHGS